VKRPFPWTLTILVIAVSMGSCVPDAVLGESGPSARSGTWSGESEDGKYTFQANIVSVANSESVVSLLTYGYPCGDRFTYVMPSKPIKLEIVNGSFEVKIERTLLTGQFTDSTHAHGTWEVLPHQISYLDTVCPEAKGTWEAGPD